MNYTVEFGHHSNGKWITDLVLDYDSFDIAKTIMEAISLELQTDNEYYVSENANVKMYDDGSQDANKQPQLCHYISAYHPELALPSFSKE